MPSWMGLFITRLALAQQLLEATETAKSRGVRGEVLKYCRILGDFHKTVEEVTQGRILDGKNVENHRFYFWKFVSVRYMIYVLGLRD